GEPPYVRRVQPVLPKRIAGPDVAAVVPSGQADAPAGEVRCGTRGRVLAYQHAAASKRLHREEGDARRWRRPLGRGDGVTTQRGLNQVVATLLPRPWQRRDALDLQREPLLAQGSGVDLPQDERRQPCPVPHRHPDRSHSVPLPGRSVGVIQTSSARGVTQPFLFMYIWRVTVHMSAEQLAATIQDRSAQGIASEVAQLINAGDLAPGTRLPSVRELAAALRVSPATVSAAWGKLKQFGSVESHGRAGTVVLGPQAPHPRRYASEGVFDNSARLELGLSVPDPDLLPDVTSYLRPAEVPDLHEYRRLAIYGPLERAVRQHWPYEGEAFAAVSSGYEGLLMALRVFVRAGENVVVEEPPPPRLLDCLEHVGCRLVFVGRDEEGIRLDDLQRALQRKPTALVLQ